MKNLKINYGISIVLVAFAIALLGCSKSDDSELPGSEYFLRFKVNGKQHEYTDAPFEVNLLGNFNRVTSGNGYGSSFGGQKNHLENEKDLMNFLISDKNELQTNVTYVNRSTTSNKIEPELFLMIYINESGVLFSTVNEPAILPDGGVLDAELIYTEVTEVFLKGKFSATLYNDSGNAITVSEGSFYLKRT